MVDNLCPSCGFPKDYPDKPLCMYCYWRSKLGTKKLVVLDILNNANTHLSVDEIIKIFDGIGFEGNCKTTHETMRRMLCRYRDRGMVTSRKFPTSKRGRPSLKWKISHRGQKRLKGYLKRWKMGFPAMLKRPNGKGLKMDRDRRERASAIRGKIGKDYDVFKYMMLTK